MDRDDGEIVVVQARPAQLGIGKVKAQRLHQMEFGAGDGGQTNSVARIARDFWSVEEDAEHRPILASPVPAGPIAAGPIALASF